MKQRRRYFSPYRDSLEVRGSYQHVLTTSIPARTYTLLLINAEVVYCRAPRPAPPASEPPACVSCIYDVGWRTCGPLPSLPSPQQCPFCNLRACIVQCYSACVHYEAKFQFGL